MLFNRATRTEVHTDKGKSQQGSGGFLWIALASVACAVAIFAWFSIGGREDEPFGENPPHLGSAAPPQQRRLPGAGGVERAGFRERGKSLPAAAAKDSAPAAERDLPPRDESFFSAGYVPDYDADDAEEVKEFRDMILDDPDPDERESALFMLSGNEHPRAIETFVEALDDSDDEVRLAAIEALDDYADSLDPYVYSNVLDDPNPEVRYAAVDALGTMDQPAALTLISKALDDPDDEVRDLAASYLPTD